jgi:insulysin
MRHKSLLCQLRKAILSNFLIFHGTVKNRFAIKMSAVPVQKPDLDHRDYHSFTLENKLKVLIVSDPKADKSAAALDVNVGHFSDADIAGLAHFCEHMLFMGSAEFPGENEYSSYLAENGGHSNAFTSTENTNYYFQVEKSGLKGALERFSKFFISPLFAEGSVDRYV